MILEGENATLNLDIEGYERDQSSSPEDRNWIRSTVHLKAGACSCSVPVAITTVEIHQFLSQLQAVTVVNEGHARFETLEEQLWIDVKLTKTGAASVEIRVLNPGPPRWKLECQFASDQTYLQASVKSLLQVLRTYPVRS